MSRLPTRDEAGDVIDYLDEDPEVPTQRYCIVSFLSPEKVIQDKNRFFFKEFMQYMNYDWKVKGLEHFMAFLSKKYGITIDDLLKDAEEAQVMAKVFQRKYPKDNIYIGKVGAWLPWDPSEHLMPEVEYAEKELNELMRKYKENEANREIFFAEQREEAIKRQKEENERRKRESSSNAAALEDAAKPVHPSEGAIRE